MDIKIFEDQTGLMMFPEKYLDKTSLRNMDIVKLFDNKIDLRITYREDILETTCYLLVHRGQERAIGCYIVGKGKFVDDYFGTFKNDANDVLKKIGFEHHYDNAENAVFDNIEKFDTSGQPHKDIDLIVEAKNSGEHINYKGGDIGEMASLCRQILGRINNIDIVISTVESNIGHVNVARSKMHDERLLPTSQGKQVLDRQMRKAEQRRFEENRKKDIEKRMVEEEAKRIRDAETRKLEEKRRLEDIEKIKNDINIADQNIEKGIALIEEGLEIKRRAGYEDTYIDHNTGIINDVINGKLSDLPSEKIEDNEDGNLDKKNRFEREEKIKKAKIGNSKIHEGTFLVKEAITSKRRAGYTDAEISSNTKIKGSCITIRSYIHQDEDLGPPRKNPTSVNTTKIIAIFVTVLFVGSLTCSWFYGIPVDIHKIIKNEQINKSETVNLSALPIGTTGQVSNVAATETVQTIRNVAMTETIRPITNATNVQALTEINGSVGN
jgi:hypothetical protein